MIDAFAKEQLHDHLRWIREAQVWKLDGLCEYHICCRHRDPLDTTSRTTDVNTYHATILNCRAARGRAGLSR